jgi:hypothetical protein
MKKFYLSVILLLSTIVIKAEKTYINGTLINQNNDPIAYASIVSYDKNSKYLSGVMSDSLGHFKISS